MKLSLAYYESGELQVTGSKAELRKRYGFSNSYVAQLRAVGEQFNQEDFDKNQSYILELEPRADARSSGDISAEYIPPHIAKTMTSAEKDAYRRQKRRLRRKLFREPLLESLRELDR